MADAREDRYAFIIDNCLYSYSQEDLLLCSNFAREHETFTGDVASKKSSPAADHSRVTISGPIVGNKNDIGGLGFPGERKELLKKRSPLMNCSGKVVIESKIDGSEVVFEGDLKVKLVRPLRGVAIDSGVECSAGRLGFEGGGDGSIEYRAKKKLEFGVDRENVVENSVKVDTEVIEEVNVGGNEGVPCVDTEVFEAVEEGETCRDYEIGNLGAKVDDFCGLDEVNVEFDEALEVSEKGECGTSKSEELVGNVGMEEVVIGQAEGKVHGETNNVVNEDNVVEEEGVNCDKIGREFDVASGEDGKGEGSGKCGNDALQEEVQVGKKRKLPRSLFEQWGEGVVNGEGCLKDVSSEGNGNESSIRCILDAVKFLARAKCFGDGGEVDFLETAKRRGMTFPRPRFRSAREGDA